MLTKMARENMSFDQALKIAQQLGYAETKDPGDDVDGRDACRKIAILASLVCGHHIYPQNIPTRGIRDITVADVQAAGKLNCVIKLIAWMKLLPGGEVAAGVEPCLVPRSNQLAGVDDVFNAVKVRGDMLGDVVFYGKGCRQTAHRQRGGGRRGGRPQTRGPRPTIPCSGSPPPRGRNAHRPGPPRHTMCVWRGPPRQWCRPFTGKASWWRSSMTAALTGWPGPTVPPWRRRPARSRRWEAASGWCCACCLRKNKEGRARR